MQHSNRKRGSAMVLMAVLGVGLTSLMLISIDTTLAQREASETHSLAFSASQIAESAASQALARMKEGGMTNPVSGSGANAEWVDFDNGEFYYYTNYDAATEVTSIRAWGRVAAATTPSESTAAPDSEDFNSSGWMIKGLEITINGGVYMPETPMYFGNGGIERPLGGFEWTGSSDPADPTTWGSVTSGASSWQSDWVPFNASANDHAMDYLYQATPPAPAAAQTPHPYNLWASQTNFGQANVEAWFTNSAGAGDPTTGLSPPPAAPYYGSDPAAPEYAYPIDPNVPDVQSYSWALWDAHNSNPSTNLLSSGSHSGTYGDLVNPEVTFVTGTLRVDAGATLKGAGILVIRDDYDPNTQTNNRPAARASVDILGNLEWTGLVIVTGWAPKFQVRPGGSTTIVGSLFGEDSVQSGGEVSLDSATIIMQVEDQMNILYSHSLFDIGGPIRQFLPAVTKTVVGIRDI